MKKISQELKRYLSYPSVWILLSFFSCILSLGNYFFSKKRLEQNEERAFVLHEKKVLSQMKKNQETILLKQLKEAETNYVEKQLEILPFLEPEMKKLQAVLHSDPHNEAGIKRMQYLQNGQNALHFTQQNMQQLDNLQEIELVQQTPVEMNGDDLKNVLAHIENVVIGPFRPRATPPQLIIKNFELTKKRLPSNEETFLIHLHLIKREFIHD